MPYDYIVVGAGAAGSVLASRLTESGRHSVCLVEAGADLTPGREPADIRSVAPFSSFNPQYMWRDNLVHWRTAADSPAVFHPQGKILGGSSALMGMFALRGHPAEYDEWRDLGAAGWDWAGVLPYFRRLETDIDFDGPLHGQDGPIPIRREPPERWTAFARAVRQSLISRQWAELADGNAEFGDGHMALPLSRYEASRASGGICYLTAAVRARANLTVRTGATAMRLLFDGRRIAGVEVQEPGGLAELRGRNIVLAAGALRSPEILLRSGIGAADALRACGVEVAADLPGVGRNLQNHCTLAGLGLLRHGAIARKGPRPFASTYARWSSGAPDADPHDMGLYVRNDVSWHALGRRMVSLAPVLSRPRSAGSVSLFAGPGGVIQRRVEFNFLSDERDLVRLKMGLRLAAELFDDPAVRAVVEPAFVLGRAARLMTYNALTPANALRAWAGAAALDLAPPLGRALFQSIAATRSLNAIVADDAALTEFALQEVAGAGHVCGTCRMGAPDDPSAVTNARGAVHGLDGLYVGDASLMPRITNANTHIPTVMIAEKIAEGLRDS